ncbi:hypothetical protein BDV06DRAFT_227354 [Aspergillus oleicola]
MTQIPTTVPEAMLVPRYHSAKDIIFRPCFLLACGLPPTTQPPQSLLDQCHTTIYSCRPYVRSAAERLREPSARDVFASTVIATMAAHNSWLKASVPD